MNLIFFSTQIEIKLTDRVNRKEYHRDNYSMSWLGTAAAGHLID
jgi:hypothetical protein